MKSLAEIFDGKKTYLGLALIAGYYAGTANGVPMPNGMLNTGWCLTVAGIAHKLDKVKTAVESLKGETK